jgi:hypothetical protein
MWASSNDGCVLRMIGNDLNGPAPASSKALEGRKTRDPFLRRAAALRHAGRKGGGEAEAPSPSTSESDDRGSLPHYAVGTVVFPRVRIAAPMGACSPSEPSPESTEVRARAVR